MIYKIFQIINYAITFGGYMILGAGCSKYCFEKEGADFWISGFIIVAMLLVNLFLNVILHEGGHLIAGLLTGYKFVSFRIGSFVWQKDKNGDIYLKKSKLPGTAGQCLLLPPNLPAKECPYVWYNLAGGLCNLVTGLIALILFLFVAPQNAITYAVFGEFALLGLTMGISNLLPARMAGIQNDGYNIIELGRNPEAKECINLVLETYAHLVTAEHFEDIPEELRQKVMDMDFTKMDITNASVGNALNHQISFYFLNGDYDKVNELETYLLNTPGVLEIFRNEAKCERMFYEIVYGDNNGDVVEELYDSKLQSYVKATAIYPARQRLLYVYYRFYKREDELAEKAYEKLLQVVKTHSIRIEANSELALVEQLRSEDMKNQK